MVLVASGLDGAGGARLTAGMTQGPPPDPAAFFREMLGQWENFTNQVGGEAMKSEAFARSMHGANAATMNAQAATHQFMDRALAAANMPSRTEFEDLSARLARIEETLGRIEAAVAAAPAGSAAPKPRRTRTAANPPGVKS